jgi:hypothetical protein
MSIKKNIEFHAEETWIINFSVNDADGVPVDISNATVEFRISQGQTPKLTLDVGNGITLTNAAQGLGQAKITPQDQRNNTLLRNKTYAYELKVVTLAFVTIQSIGELKVLNSLFATV